MTDLGTLHVHGIDCGKGELMTSQQWDERYSGDVLYRVSEVTETAVDAGLTIGRAERAVRLVDTDLGSRQALDTVVTAQLPPRRGTTALSR